MHSSMINPFSLQKDNKNFFFGITDDSDTIQGNRSVIDVSGRIRNMNKELQELSRRRQEMLFKQSQLNYIFKKQKPKVNLRNLVGDPRENDKKFRVKQLLKEKRESIHELLNKKREIYLAKMNINLKKQETIKISNSIKDQQENLKSRKMYFENDIEFIYRFIHKIKTQTLDAQHSLEQQVKQAESLNSISTQLDSELEKYTVMISKEQEHLNLIHKYADFITSFENPERNYNKYTPQALLKQEVLFMTQKGADVSSVEDQLGFVINLEPKNMIQIFNERQEKNIDLIQQLQDQQYCYEEVARQQKQQMRKWEETEGQYMKKIKKLEREIEEKIEDNSKMNTMKSKKKKIQIMDDQYLNVEALEKKINDIYSQYHREHSQPITMMTSIEIDIFDMKQQIQNLHAQHPQHIEQVAIQYQRKLKKLKQEAKNQQTKREAEIKKIQSQTKKDKLEGQKIKGRRDMAKVLIPKDKKKRKIVANTKINEDSIYFEEEPL